MSKVGLTRSSQGPCPLMQGAGPAYNVPSVFDMENRLFSAPSRAGHVQTRDWLDFRWSAELSRAPGPGAFRHSTADRTGKWDAPIERLTSGLPQSKACQGSPAYTLGLPRNMLPHMDPMSSARRTPSVQSHEAFISDKHGKWSPVETILSQHRTSPTHSMALRTPYTGADLRFTCNPNSGVPGVGAYETEVRERRVFDLEFIVSESGFRV
jgi:hypothetical protein